MKPSTTRKGGEGESTVRSVATEVKRDLAPSETRCRTSQPALPRSPKRGARSAPITYCSMFPEGIPQGKPITTRETRYPRALSDTPDAPRTSSHSEVPGLSNPRAELPTLQTWE